MSTTRNTTTRDRHRHRLSLGRPACHLCGEPVDYTAHHSDPRSFVVDHVIPLIAGGTDTIDNKAPAHRACNSRKGRRLVAPIVRRSGTLA